MTDRPMRVLDLFSGIGGFSLGLERTGGFQTVAFCEIDPFCRAVLAKHWPDVPCHDDITTREFKEGEADVVVGGFPCQDISLAGKRAGLSGERSGLYRELVRALRLVRPRHAIVENVAALLSDGMDVVLGDLAAIGYDAEWDCIPACAVGAPHERDRVWIVAHASGESKREPSDKTNAFAVKRQAWMEPTCLFEDVLSPDAAAAARAERREDAASCDRLAGPLGLSQRQESPGRSGGASEAVRALSGADAARQRCGQERTRRPPDSFARIRIEARRNAADPLGARLAFREGLTRDAYDQLTAAERDALGNGAQSIWPDEPALSRVDDGIQDWLDRVAATGNTVVPQIPELIGRAIRDAEAEA